VERRLKRLDRRAFTSRVQRRRADKASFDHLAGARKQMGGIFKPRVLAVLRLMANSNLDD
jgi:hypothetical protein